MAGHSHWAGIKHKKAIVDAKRGRLWSKLARAIIMAARQHWFEDEAPAAADAPASTDASEGEEA